MPGNFHDDTSYKYRWNQEELLGKILSGTLDEDLYISNLRIDSAPKSNWRLNPIFTGHCFAGKHSLHVGVTISIDDAGALKSLCSSATNITSLRLDIAWLGPVSSDGLRDISLTELCRYATDLERVEIRTTNDKAAIGDMHTAFMNSPKLKTLIFRCNRVATGSKHFISSSPVDVIVFDSPKVATLSDTDGMKNEVFKSGGTGGTIYIPKSLYDHLGDGSEYDYKAATNWSTLDGYGTITWAQIEGSEYELT